MAKVITFSRTFPAYHPRKGQPTRFVEQILNSFNPEIKGVEFIFPFDYEDVQRLNPELGHSVLANFINNLENRTIVKGKKFHTIRSGSRFSKGDMFSPRVWAGKPYNSKQIILAPDMEVAKVWDIEISKTGILSINGFLFLLTHPIINVIAKNDGLTRPDFFDWFKLPHPKFEGFKGQIICWDSQITY